MRFSRPSTTAVALNLALVTAVVLSFAAQLVYSQAISTNGGSIQGTVTDPSGAFVLGARITIGSPDTGYSKVLTSDSAGFYSLGPLAPGRYTITVEAPGFERLVVKTSVAVGTVSSGNAMLKIGSTGTTVQVDAGALQINTDQIGVAGTISQQQLETLPVNGHNVLDAAQLQPGVILQSGMSFDPTKAGYSALSVSGIGGRTTRILLDGQDITDETVGTTIFNVPEGAVGEMQLNRATQDVSGEVTSTGQVLAVTRAGTNRFHGNAFYNFQDDRAGFATILGSPAPFQRNQFGGYIGGPIVKDKLFFYGGAERIKQDENDTATGYDPAFTAIAAQYPFVPAPFRDTFSFARLDYEAPHQINLFVRAVYSVNADDATYGYEPYSVYQNRDNVPALVGGADFTTGKFTHSFRVGYEKFHNILGDGTAGLGSSIYNPSSIMGFPITLYGSLFAGQNYLAPQGTFQSDKQFRYDATWTKGAHNFKFGGEVNRILGGGFAEFFGASLFTELFTAIPNTDANGNPACADVLNSVPCPSDPLKGYDAYAYVLGNGNGLFTEKPGFGLKGGGEFSHRFAAYIGDTWKAKPYLTITGGVRWSVDTDRANQDLPSPTCGQVDPSMQWSGCSSDNSSAYLFDQYQKGLGGKVHQPYADFGPQLGFVFSPGSRKTSYRGGAGIYYEGDIFNNTGNARPEVIPTSDEGPYFGSANANYGSASIFLPGVGAVLQAPDGTPVSTILSESIYNAAPEVNDIRSAWQAQVKGVNVPNPNFVGTGYGLYADNLYSKRYLSPYSIQLNGGVQHQFAEGLMLSADYVHNAILKVPSSIDVNHDGAARTLNTTAAANAIATVLEECGVATIDDAITSCPGLYSSGGVSISDFASAGLDSGAAFLNGSSASAYGLTPDIGAAFPGTNPNVGTGLFILPSAKSAYDALQVVFQEQKQHPIPGLNSSNFQASYTLSRAETSSTGSGSSSQDQFFAGSRPYDNDAPTKYIGRSDLDHTNELSFGGSIGVKGGFELGAIGHFYSGHATPLTINTAGQTVGEIFQTDLDGDGTVGDLLPGTEPGAYMHQVKGKGLNQEITAFNSKYAGQLTPAGQALVSAGLFTQTELTNLGAVVPTLASQPGNDPRPNPAFRTLDANISYPIKLKWLGEGGSITPTASFYNLFNLANFGPVETANGGAVLTESEASVPNYMNSARSWSDVNTSLRTTRNSGTFDQGGPRSAEFSLKIEF
ncbi:MAG: carboxypeptidase regulatory-like domain-containing protein [Terracidiphilus sp.]|jgi:hypothetical protein